jgi:hypothetical protein
MPDNTLPMMTGSGPFGSIEMGGMFSVVKIRDGLARDDYKDPGPYKHPQGTVAYEIETPQSEAPRQVAPNDKSKPAGSKDMKGMKGMKSM